MLRKTQWTFFAFVHALAEYAVRPVGFIPFD